MKKSGPPSGPIYNRSGLSPIEVGVAEWVLFKGIEKRGPDSVCRSWLKIPLFSITFIRCSYLKGLL